MHYIVVMPVISVRLSNEDLHARLKNRALQESVGVSPLAERLIDEGLRMSAHPYVYFRSGASGRRPVLVGGPEVANVVSAIVGGDVPVDERRARASQMLAIPLRLVDAALAYYAEFTDEIDQWLARRSDEADRAEAAWRTQQQLLSG